MNRWQCFCIFIQKPVADRVVWLVLGMLGLGLTPYQQ